MARKKQPKAKAPRARTATKKRNASARTAARRTAGTRKPATGRARRVSQHGASRARVGAATTELFELLKADHKQVADQFDEIKELIEDEERDQAAEAQCLEMFRSVYRDLTAHARAEEQAVYPVLLREEQTSDTTYEAQVEHGLVEHLLELLIAADSFDEVWAARLKVVRELVEHHVEEEEGEMFKQARKALDKGQLEALAADFQRARSAQLARLDGAMEPSQPDVADEDASARATTVDD